MSKYEVNFYDPENGATSPIDVIEAPDNYTSDDYISDCLSNADEEYCSMLLRGVVELFLLDEEV